MIESIYIAPEHSANQQQVEEINLVAKSGIVGDRNFNKSNWPGQNITFIEQEEIDAYNSACGQNIEQRATRRNIITKGIRLNELVGKEFTIGSVKFLGIELCEPCRTLGEILENDAMPRKDVVKAFLHKSGLRADILTDGTISVGMEINC